MHQKQLAKEQEHGIMINAVVELRKPLLSNLFVLMNKRLRQRVSQNLTQIGSFPMKSITMKSGSLFNHLHIAKQLVNIVLMAIIIALRGLISMI